MNPKHEQRGTRERLLAAAGEVFAESGYAAATVREICHRGKANVAAVNYHFGNKEKLYAAVLVHFMGERARLHPLDGGLHEAPTPEQRLHAFVSNFLRRLCCDDPYDQAHAKLVMQEIVDPSPVFDELVHAFMQPVRDAVGDVVRSFLGEDAPVASVRGCSAGVVGQVLFYLQNRTILERMYGDIAYDASGLDRVAANITRFSLGGITHWMRSGEGA